MKKLSLLIGLAALGAASTWAIADEAAQPTTTTVQATELTVPGATTVGDYTVTVDKATGTTPPKVYASQDALRAYAGNTISISGEKFTSVKFVLASGNARRYTTVECSTGAIEPAQAAGDTCFTWVGEATEVTFTVGAKATLGTDGETKAGQLHVAKIEISGFSNSGNPEEPENPENPDPENPFTPVGDGTLENPYNVATAINLITTGAIPADSVHVAGVISSIGLVNTSFGNADYYIKDENGTEVFYIYRGYNLGNQKFTAETQLEAGAKVIVYGKLINYMSNTPEMAAGNYIVSYNGKTTPDEPENPDPENPDPEIPEATGTEPATILASNFTVPGVTQSEGYVIDIEKGTGSNAPAYYAGTDAVRLYNNNTLSVAGGKLTKVRFVLAKDVTFRYTTVDCSTGAIEPAQAMGDSIFTWVGDATQVVFTVGEQATLGSDGETKKGQIRFTKLEINMPDDTPDEPEKPTYSKDGNFVVNGSFHAPGYEQAVPEGYTWEPYSTYENLTVLPGWIVEKNSEWNGIATVMSKAGDGVVRPETDNHYLKFRAYDENGWTDIMMSQVIALTAGQTYRLSFAAGANIPEGTTWTPDPNYGFRICEVNGEGDEVSAGNTVMAVNLAEGKQAPVEYALENYVYEFVAPSDGRIYLTFYLNNNYFQDNPKEDMYMDLDRVRIIDANGEGPVQPEYPDELEEPDVPFVPVGDGTFDNPYNVATALHLIATDAIPAGEVHVAGTISEVREVNTSYGNASYNIKDEDGSETLYIYRGFYLGKEKFTADTEFEAGAKVVVVGTLVNYRGNTPEMSAENYLVKYNDIVNIPQPDIQGEISGLYNVVPVGGNIRLEAIITPENATLRDIVWETTDPNIGTVDSDGNVAFHNPGEVAIMASLNGSTYGYIYLVENVEAEGFELFPKYLQGREGAGAYIVGVHTPDNTTDKNITWSSDNENVATVDADGQVYFKGEGKAVITAVSGNHTATCDILVGDFTDITSVGASGVEIAAADKAIVVRNLPDLERVIVYSLEGRAVAGAVSLDGSVRISLASGVYIVKAADVVAKVLVY